MKRNLVMIVTFLVLVSPVSAHAAGLCCQVSSGSQESLLDSTLPESGKFSLQLLYSFTMMDELKEGSSTVSLQDVKNDGKYTKLPDDMHMIKYTLNAVYDINDTFTAFISIPYVRNTMDMEMGMSMGMGMGTKWMDHTMTPIQELGDVTVMGLYHYYLRGGGIKSDILTFGLGVKTPTGSATVRGSSGRFIHAHMQPGTGSWDPLFSLMYTKDMAPFLLQGDLTYQLTTRNRDGYEFGDSFTANVTGRYAVTSSFNLTAAATYLHVNRADDRDDNYTDPTSLMDDPDNTGGDSIWLSPGIKVRPFKNNPTAIDLKAQFPVWERVNGIQLVSTYRILAGITFIF